MKELENAANIKKGNRFSHAGRRGYLALQEITTLKGTEGYQGLSVLVVGPTNPEQLHLSPDGLTIVNADSMIRDQFKAFLRGIDFRKGVFFLTMDKTNASLAAAEGLTALRIQYPRRLRKGDELAMPKEESVLLARLVYELAIEFGTIRVTWDDHGPHHLDLEGAWTWKSMEHWEAWQLMVSDLDPGIHKALNRYVDGSFDPRRFVREWQKLADILAERSAHPRDPTDPLPCEPDQISRRVAHAADLLVPDPNSIFNRDFEEPESAANRLQLEFLGEGHAVVDERQSGQDRPPERPHAGLGVADPRVVQAPKCDVEDLVAHAVHARHRAVREAGGAVPGDEVGAVFRERRQEVGEPGCRVRQIGVERRDERAGRRREAGLVGATVAPSRLGHDPSPFRDRDAPRPVSRICVDDQNFEVPVHERAPHFVDHGADRGLLVHRRDDDGDLGHWRAPCWVRRIRVSRSAGQRLPEELVPDVSEESTAQSQERPEARPLPKHLLRTVAAPEHPMLQRELLPPGSVPEGLPEEIEHGGARAVVDDCVRSERNRVTGPDRTHVQVDILRRDEPLIEPADLVEH